ncbi:response regulator [Spirosoma areae]
MSSDFLILVIDDDPPLLDILKFTAKSGFPEARFIQVHSTGDAKTYFANLTGHGPRLILLDINLGSGENGLDFLRILREDRHTHIIPVLMLTVSDSASDIKAAYELGVSSFTNKPDTTKDWITYFERLRIYWLKTVTLPKVFFRKQD